MTEPTFKEQVDALSRQMDKCEDRKRLVSQPVFKEFLESNAPTLYKEILNSILSERHGEKRANLQEKREQQLLYGSFYITGTGVLKGAIILVTTLFYRKSQGLKHPQMIYLESHSKNLIQTS